MLQNGHTISVWFQMTRYGVVKAIEYLDQAGLIELAESLAIKP